MTEKEFFEKTLPKLIKNKTFKSIFYKVIKYYNFRTPPNLLELKAIYENLNIIYDDNIKKITPTIFIEKILKNKIPANKKELKEIS